LLDTQTTSLVNLTASMRPKLQSVMFGADHIGRTVDEFGQEVEDIHDKVDGVNDKVDTLSAMMRKFLELEVQEDTEPRGGQGAALPAHPPALHNMKVLCGSGESGKDRFKWPAAAATFAATITSDTAAPYLQFLRDAPKFAHALAGNVTLFKADWGELTQALSVKHRDDLAQKNDHFTVHSVANWEGGGGQEVNVRRRANCHHWMGRTAAKMIHHDDSKRTRDLADGKSILHSDANVCIKGSEARGVAYRLLNGDGLRAHPFSFHLLESAPIDTSKSPWRVKEEMGCVDVCSDGAGPSMCVRVDNLLRTCAKKGKRHLVLSPFGWQCGACTDSKSTRRTISAIAKVFYQQLACHSSDFDVVALAIDEAEHGKGTFELFQQAWDQAHSRSIDDEEKRARVRPTQWACCACLGW
jgi:hypothetical protein